MPKNAPKLQPETWVDNHSDYLYNYAISRIKDLEMALDLVQDTFVSAFKAKDRFLGKSSERTWLISILKRKIIDYYRKAYRSKETLSDNLSYDDNYAEPFDENGAWSRDRAPKNWDSSTDAIIESEEFNIMLQQCIEGLNEKQAAVFKLQVMEELQSDEICKELEISSSNFWVLIHRARLKLRECVEHNWLHI